MLYLSLLLVIVGAVFYEILEEKAPTKENHYLFLMLAYFVSLFFLFIYLIITKYDFNNILKDLNYQSFLVGIAALFADYGLITSYNSGWKISTLNITYSISTFLILLLIGSTFFNEIISNIKILGIIISIISIFLINHKATREKGKK
jgi:drug/metabolite transporter (DMT)-like permease